MSVSVTDLFIYFGIFLGFIMTLVILTKMKGDRQIRISLSIYLLFGVISLIIGDLNFSGKAQEFPYLVRIDSPIHFLYGPFAFYYMYASLKPGFRFRKIYLLHLIPFFINFFIFSPLYFSSKDFKTDYYHQVMESGTYTLAGYYALKILSGITYLTLQIFYYNKFKFNFLDKENSKCVLEKWFRIYFFIQAILLSTILINRLLPADLMADPYLLFMLMLTILMISTSVALMFFPSLLYGIQETPAKAKEKYFFSRLSQDEKEMIFLKLNDYLLNGDKPYTNPQLSLPATAQILDLKQNQLSQVINERSGNNFNDFINSFRIKEAKTILVSEDYKRLTIDAIAMKAGFKSKTAFYKAFREHTGMTPKQYAKSILPGS
jgi:AraC-like DNA-binding protein